MTNPHATCIERHRSTDGYRINATWKLVSARHSDHRGHNRRPDTVRLLLARAYIRETPLILPCSRVDHGNLDYDGNFARYMRAKVPQ
jgi:hypothetical protein